MARTEGTQSIPSALLYMYKGTLGEQRPNTAVHRRYPWKLPTMRAGKSNETAGQRLQRTRFRTVVASFHTISQTEKGRWYDTMPEWNSLLWYYNWFIASGIMDVLGGNPEGASVIKTIKHYPFILPSGNPTDVPISISDVNPAKAMAFFYGAGVKEISENIGVAVYPYLSAILTSSVIVLPSMAMDQAAGCSVSIIEYI